MLDALTADITKSSEIEGEILNVDQVRSSVARHLGIEIEGLPEADRYIDGVVQVMIDATQNYMQPLTAERFFNWHAALFPTGRSGVYNGCRLAARCRANASHIRSDGKRENTLSGS
jgi:Fic family protein